MERLRETETETETETENKNEREREGGREGGRESITICARLHVCCVLFVCASYGDGAGQAHSDSILSAFLGKIRLRPPLQRLPFGPNLPGHEQQEPGAPLERQPLACASMLYHMLSADRRVGW